MCHLFYAQHLQLSHNQPWHKLIYFAPLLFRP
jgi:hypothetical protein